MQGQNIQVASGVLNQPPVPNQLAFQVAVRTLGRLSDPAEFGNIVVKQTQNAVVRIKDVARVELTGQDYSSSSYLGRNPSVAIAVFQRPGSNALTTGNAIRSTTAELAKNFPEGMQYTIIYDPTQFIRQSVDAVIETIFEAVILVVLVIVLFLQTWRAAVIPIVAIPISLIGTFFMMSLFGFTLNNLSLFGLVLAIGIVVDDAIVVVENVERNIEQGLQSARRRDQVDGRGRRRADRDRARAVRGVHPGRLHHRHFRAVLSAIRAHHCRRDRDLADRLADAVAGDVRAAAQAAQASSIRSDGGRSRCTASSAISISASTGCRRAMAGSPAARCGSR